MDFTTELPKDKKWRKWANSERRKISHYKRKQSLERVGIKRVGILICKRKDQPPKSSIRNYNRNYRNKSNIKETIFLLGFSISFTLWFLYPYLAVVELILGISFLYQLVQHMYIEQEHWVLDRVSHFMWVLMDLYLWRLYLSLNCVDQKW